MGWIGLQTQKCDRNDLAPTIAVHQQASGTSIHPWQVPFGQLKTRYNRPASDSRWRSSTIHTDHFLSAFRFDIWAPHRTTEVNRTNHFASFGLHPCSAHAGRSRWRSQLQPPPFLRPGPGRKRTVGGLADHATPGSLKFDKLYQMSPSSFRLVRCQGRI